MFSPCTHMPFTDDALSYIDMDEFRTQFAVAMSDMYKKEVPLYGTLIRLVRAVNDEILATSSNPRVTALRNGDVASERLDLERHGAIRLGTAYELRTVRRMFAIIGLHPVGYYDLSPAGLPMHATCFRPVTAASLKKNPFRVFTTLLRPELLTDAATADLALDLLSKREIFSPELLQLLDIAESHGMRLTKSQGDDFISEAMKTFGWRPEAAASQQAYQFLKREHPILADIACFQTAHINHLTPRTLDIAVVQERMKSEGLNVKVRIEGPPQRQCPILLRQTSFLALEEGVMFKGNEGNLVEGSHKARFGEVEERGAAVTRQGRDLYDELLEEAMDKIATEGNAARQDQILEAAFSRFPDSWDELRRHGLVYFTFRCSLQARGLDRSITPNLEDLLSDGIVEAIPTTYEDFLPLSAAGIFQSNLQSDKPKRTVQQNFLPCSNIEGYKEALGCSMIDLDESYAALQRESLKQCAEELGLPPDSL